MWFEVWDGVGVGGGVGRNIEVGVWGVRGVIGVGRVGELEGLGWVPFGLGSGTGRGRKGQRV